MLKKLITIFLLVYLLAGCAAAPAEIAPKTTVADTRQYVFTEGLCCYHIPKISAPNARQINETLYDIYYDLLQAEVFELPVESRSLLGLTYEVGQKGDVVSVTVLQRGDCDLDSYDVYYFSASTGEELTKEAVFAAFGMTLEAGQESIRKAMERNFDMAQKINGSEDPFFLEQKEKTLADENVAAAKPLIAANGELQFVGEFYALAGADSYWHRSNLQGELLEMACPEHN